MRIETQLEQMEREVKALKASFMQSAAQMNIITTKINFSTEVNICSFDNHQSHDYKDWRRLYGEFALFRIGRQSNQYYCDEPVEVTFRSNNGSNIIGNLEISNYANAFTSEESRLTVEQSGSYGYTPM